MKPLLMVMRPRDIPRCIAAIGGLDIDKVWFEYMTEAMIVGVMPDAIGMAKRAGYTHALLLSDDTVPTQAALDLVLGLSAIECLAGRGPHPRLVTTAYCNLDASKPEVNLTKRPFTILTQSYGSDYAFYTREEVVEYRSPFIATWFTGACLSCMPIDLWETYPFEVLGGPGHPGYGSDWKLSVRLQRDHVPILAPKHAFIEHVKEVWNQRDQSSEKRLLIGERPAGVRWDTERGITLQSDR